MIASLHDPHQSLKIRDISFLSPSKPGVITQNDSLGMSAKSFDDGLFEHCYKEVDKTLS